MDNINNLPIGVFDSGIGGLTVLQALTKSMPQESFLYLGDTARLPYGIKSADTVTKYALQACQLLVQFGVKAIVIACNTVSAYALPTLQATFPHLPIIGVIEPGASAAVAASQSGRIAIIATEATINNKAYENSITKLRPDSIITGTSCSLFVPLAEEGWVSGDVPIAIAKNYLSHLFGNGHDPDCLVLGCTHFPALRSTIREVIGDKVAIVDSASTTASTVASILQEKLLLTQNGTGDNKITFLATDNPERFTRVANNLLQMTLSPENIELVDITHMPN